MAASKTKKRVAMPIKRAVIKRAVIVGTGSIVLSTGRELPIRVEIAVDGRALTKRESTDLEATRVVLHDLGMVEFRASLDDYRTQVKRLLSHPAV